MAATELKLREYQREALDKVYDSDGKLQRPAVVLPTGAGKTVIFSHLVREHRESSGSRVLILVHRDELADQTLGKLASVSPNLRAGKVKAKDDDVTADVVVASVQTLGRQARLDRLMDASRLHGHIGLVIVDECHHAAAPTYLRILEALGCFDGRKTRLPDYFDTRAVGFTATLARGDGVGLGSVWEDVVYSKTVLWMISRGYLTDVKAQAIDVGLDLSKVAKSSGDYQAGALGAELMELGAPQILANVIHQYAPERRPIVFTPTVEVAAETAAALTASGIPAGFVYGGTPRDERLATYASYRQGTIRALVNCMVLTEGADFPWADCAVIARPTQSETLYTQMVGRVLRPFPGKTDALVLNVAGSGGRLRTLIDLEPGLVIPPNPGETLAEAYTRQEERADQKVAAGSLAFALKHRDLDLFAASSQAWLRTPAGLMFLSVGNAYIFIWPERNGNWGVAYAPPGGKAQWLHRDLTMGTAMAWAETEAEENGAFSADRGARWRKNAPQPRMVNMARAMGVEVPEGIRQGDLADRMAIRQASAKFDHWVRKNGS